MAGNDDYYMYVQLHRGQFMKVRLFETSCLARGCQDLSYLMYSASISIVLHCLLFTLPGPDHPRFVSGNTLTHHCACISTLVEHHSLPKALCRSGGGSIDTLIDRSNTLERWTAAECQDGDRTMTAACDHNRCNIFIKRIGI